jgi:N-acetylneuraminic acid mutarotase
MANLDSVVNLQRLGLLKFHNIFVLCLSAGGLDEERSYNVVERYDHETDRWNQVAPMTGMRCGAGATALGEYLYVVGGNDGESSSNSVERYDPHLNKWTTVTSMNCKRAGGGVATLDGYIYAVGGFADVVPLNTVER